MRSFDSHFDPIQEPDDEDEKRPSCNRCGSRAVRWRRQGGQWVLFSLQPGVEHRCAQACADEFDEVAP